MIGSFLTDGRGFSITFNSGTEKGDAQKSSPKNAPKSAQKILEAVAENPEITITQLSEICGISTRAVQKNIEALKKKGHLLRIGSDRGGQWKIGDGQKKGS